MVQRETTISYQIDSILTDVSQEQTLAEKGIRQIDGHNIQIKDQLYRVVVDYRDGFEIAAFEQRYQDYFEKFDFIVGDWGFEQLRLRGFYQLNQRKVPKDQTIDFLEDYINEYCNFGCRYFVLAKEQEVAKFAKLRERKAKEQPRPRQAREHPVLGKIQVRSERDSFSKPKLDVKPTPAKKKFKQTKWQHQEFDQFEPATKAPTTSAKTQRRNKFVIKQKNQTNG